ncbi:hypothetical protein B0H11DRAFT_477213 [Mycena galericulata]|nr:hypothetical protein B0H11DRAFT_477213 [Mycena galericulata]
MLLFKVSFPSSARSHYYYTGSSSISFVAASSTKPSFVMLSIMLYNPAVRSCPFSTHRKFDQGPCRSAAVAPRGRMSLRLASVLHIARRLSTLTHTTTCASHKYVLLLSSLTCELIQLRRCVVWNIRFVFYSTKLPPTDKIPSRRPSLNGTRYMYAVGHSLKIVSHFANRQFTSATFAPHGCPTLQPFIRVDHTSHPPPHQG